MLAGLRGDRSVRVVCREYQIAETQSDQWRERLLDGDKTASANPREKTPSRPSSTASGKVGRLERALGCKTYEPEVAGERSRGWE